MNKYTKIKFQACSLWLLGFMLCSVFSKGNLELKFSNAINNYYEPIIVSEILNKNVPQKIMQQYEKGMYRNAIVNLRRLKKLQLPDGRLDAYTFLEAECYFQMKLWDFALNNYREIVEFFPGSPYVIESYFRLVQIADKKGSDSLIIRYHNLLKQKAPKHILLSGSSYLLSKSYYTNTNTKAAKLEINNIQFNSPYYFSGRFLFALCLIEEEKYKEAIKILENISEKSNSPLIKDESLLTIGVLYSLQKQPEKALEYYSQVSKSSDRFALATLKKAQIHFTKKQYPKVIKAVTPILKNPSYFFEASLVLLDTYWTLKDSVNATIVRNQLSLHAKLTRILIILEEEKIFLRDLNHRLSAFSNEPNIKENVKENKDKFNARANKQIDAMTNKLEKVKNSLKTYLPENQKITVSGIREKKLMQIYNINLKLLETEIKTLKKTLATQDSLGNSDNKGELTLKLNKLSQTHEESSHVIDELFNLNQNIANENSEAAELQPKYIDVGMILYNNLKTSYQRSNQKIREYTQRLEELMIEKQKREQSPKK